MFSAKFHEQEEEDQLLDEVELFISLKNNRNLTQSDIDYNDARSQLERQIQNQETTDGGWRFDKFVSATIFFYKTTELNGSRYVKTPMRTSVFLNIQNDDKFCFIWPVLSQLQPVTDSNNGHATRTSTYRRYFDELNIQGFDFRHGFNFSDVQKLRN